MALVHHELCFGCGQTDLLGTLLEVEILAPARWPAVASSNRIIRVPTARPRMGVIAAALAEAMALSSARGAGAIELRSS